MEEVDSSGQGVLELTFHPSLQSGYLIKYVSSGTWQFLGRWGWRILSSRPSKLHNKIVWLSICLSSIYQSHSQVYMYVCVCVHILWVAAAFHTMIQPGCQPLVFCAPLNPSTAGLYCPFPFHQREIEAESITQFPNSHTVSTRWIQDEVILIIMS